MHRFTLHKTRSAMRLGVLHAPRFKRALVQLYFRAGSRFETAKTSGSTHLLEHVLFRGTDRYPSREILEEAFHTHQVDANAYTEREWVAIHMTSPRKNVAAAIRLAFEIGFRPRFMDVEVERSIVDAEIRENRVGDGLTFERIGQLLWGNHPLGFPVAGSRSPHTSRRGLKALHRRFFRPGNSFLMVSGNLTPAQVQGTVRSCLRGLEPGALRLPPPPPVRRGPILCLDRDLNRGLRAVFHLQVSRQMTDSERLYLWMVGRMLELRLNRIIREDRGACYDLFMDEEFGHRLNAISINALVTKASGPMLIREIFHQLGEIRQESGDPRDLERLRAGMVRGYEIMEDDLHDLTDFYARQHLLSPHLKTLRPVEACRAVKAITMKTLAETARRLLGPRELSLLLLSSWTPQDRKLWKKRFHQMLGTLQ